MKQIGQALSDLGIMLDNGDTTISDLTSAAREIGLAIQFRLVPFNDTLYVLDVPTQSDDNDGEVS